MKKTILICTLAATALAAFAKEPAKAGKGPGGHPRPEASEERRHGPRDGGFPGAAFVSEEAMALAAELRENPEDEAKKAALEARLRADYEAALARAKEKAENMEKNRDARIEAAMKKLVSPPPEGGRPHRPGPGGRKPHRGDGGAFPPPPPRGEAPELPPAGDAPAEPAE